ncbi:MAG: hypothetical protein J5855_01655 [Mailhella sp.]|nr:hypothetical protein [Mailhella sp.]
MACLYVKGTPPVKSESPRLSHAVQWPAPCPPIPAHVPIVTKTADASDLWPLRISKLGGVVTLLSVA